MRVPSPIKMPSQRYIDEQKTVIHEARINQGMVTSVDPSDIDTAAVQDLLNARVRYDKTLVRVGHTVLTPTKPDSSTIQAIYTFKKNDGTRNVLRFDEDKVYKRGAGSWTEITGTLTGTTTDRFQVITAFDQCVFTNGVDDIQVCNTGLTTHADLGNAPKYKYITAFYNRVVGANYVHATTPNPIQVGWSKDGDITEWDPLNHPSAGSNPLIESPGDLADFITGVFGFTSVMLIPRERSIWIATKQPSATYPFYFSCVVPGKGCNAPYSISVIPNGIAYIDAITRKVNVFQPGMPEPTSIGLAIEKQLFASFEDPSKVFASFNGKYSEYTIAVPAVGTTKIWRYNFETKGWAYDEIPAVNCMADTEGLGSYLSVDELPGTVDSLTGTVDNLVAASSAYITRLYGRTDGDIWQEDESVLTDAGSSYTTRVVGKNFYLEKVNSAVVKLQFEFIVRSAGTVKLYYSKDAGSSWTFAKNFVFTFDDIGQVRTVTFIKNMRSRRFTWKLESAGIAWELIDYEVHVVESGDERK